MFNTVKMVVKMVGPLWCTPTFEKSWIHPCNNAMHSNPCTQVGTQNKDFNGLNKRFIWVFGAGQLKNGHQ